MVKLRVAVKEVLQADAPLQQVWISREEQVLTELTNRPYSVKFYGPARHVGSSAFLLMGLAQGKNLDVLCKRIHFQLEYVKSQETLVEVKRWTWALALQVVYKLAEALADMHPGRSHRDIKLDNIVTSDYLGSHVGLKLVDWASSRRITEGDMLLACFTPRYCSPQLLNSTPRDVLEDAPTDVWALGCVLHLMLSAANTTSSYSFGPSAAEDAQIREQPKEQWQSLLKACITSHHKAWAAHLAQGDSVSPQAAWQLEAVQEASSFMPESEASSAQQQMNALLQGVWHPDSTRRWTAQDVLDLEWLRNAAAKPLPTCPPIIVSGIR